MNLCIDCRWFLKNYGPAEESGVCGHSSALTARAPSPVTGEPQEPVRELCRFHRNRNWSDDPCGPDGKYWEAAEPRGFA
jgi:hypothetical protein